MKDPAAVALGEKRWKGVPKKDRQAHGKMMANEKKAKKEMSHSGTFTHP